MKPRKALKSYSPEVKERAVRMIVAAHTVGRQTNFVAVRLNGKKIDPKISGSGEMSVKLREGS